MEDRSKMMPGRDFADIPKLAPHARDQVRSLLAMLETQLADGRPWLLGEELSLADAACFHPLWFLRVAPRAAQAVSEFPRVVSWTERVAATGAGERSDMAPGEALAIARDSRPARGAAGGGAVDPREPNALAAGMRVAVTPDDYAFDPVEGQLAASDPNEVAILRRDASLGEIAVHFPRVGFRVTPA